MSDHIYLAHHGIKDQKWGVRRFQNKDGSLTAEGRLRYDEDGTKLSRAARKHMRRADTYDRIYNEETAKTKQRNARDKAAGKLTKEVKDFRRDADNEWKEFRDVELRRAKRTQQYHTNAKKYWDNMSAGKKVGTMLLYGPIGAQSYVAAKGRGSSTMYAAGETILANALGGPIGNVIVNNVQRSDYAKRGE